MSLTLNVHFALERNREKFKNFVNTLAAVKSDGVSYVCVRPVSRPCWTIIYSDHGNSSLSTYTSVR